MTFWASQVNELVRARSRILIFTICFTISILFMALMYLEPIVPKEGESNTEMIHDTSHFKVVLLALIMTHVVLFLGILFFHFVNKPADIEVPFNVLAGVIFVIWFLLCVGSIVYVVFANRESVSGNRTRIVSIVFVLLLWLLNLIYFVAGRVADRAAKARALLPATQGAVPYGAMNVDPNLMM